MIYTFDKNQNLIGTYDEKEELTVANLNLKINKAATLDLEFPANKENIKSLKNVVFLAVPYPNNKQKLLFLRVMTRTDKEYTIELMAKEFAYQELATSGYIEDKRFKDANAKTLISGAVQGSGYTVSNVNVSGTAQLNFYYEDYLTAVSDVIEALGGEVIFYVTLNGNKISGRYVDYVIAQGTNTSKTFAYGSNLISVERQSDASEVYTAILPRGKGELVSTGEDDAPDGYGRRINIAEILWKKPTNPLDKPVGSLVLEDPSATAAFGQANGTARLLLKTYDDIEDKNELINAAYRDLLQYNHPATQFTASVANIGYSALGDTIVIMHSDRGMSYRTRIFEIDYDLIEINNTVATFGDNLSKNNTSNMLTSVSRAINNVKETANFAVASANGIGNDYYGENEPTNPKNGDTWFYTAGDGFGIRQYVDGQWVEYVNSKTSEQITQQVETAIANAKEYANNLNATQMQATNSVASDLAKKADELTKNQQSIANQATAYTDSAVADANAKAVEIGQTTAQNAQKALDDKATTLQQSIDTKVAKTDYDQKTGELTTSVNTAQQTADTATQTIGTYKESNDKRVTAAETNIKANSEAIELTASKTELNQATGKLSGDISTLQQRADGFEATVTKVNNLSVGGRNLLIGSQDYSGSAWEAQANLIKSDFQGLTSSTNSYDWGGPRYRNSALESQGAIASVDTEYVFSAWFKNTGTSDTDIYFFGDYVSHAGYFIATIPAKSGWMRVSTKPFKFTKTSGLTGVIKFENAMAVQNGVVKQAGLKLEIGNIATDWTPAPEDVDAQIAQVKITADGVYQTVNDPKTGLNTRVSTAEGNISTIKSNVDGIGSTVTQTANGLTQEIADRKTGDNNTLQAGKDFTTSQITSYDTGMQSRLSQVSDGIMAQVSSTNLITDSSFVNATSNWTLSGDVTWKINNEIMRKGVRVATFDNGSTNFDRKTSTLTSTPIYTTNLGGTQFYASIDIYAQSFGSSAYMKAEIVQKNSSGTTTKTTAIGGSFDAAMTDWNTYTADITLDPATTQLYLQVTQYGGGKVSIARPYLGSIKLNAGDYIPGASTDNTSTLKLFNNFFAFGIQSNTGEIISGINGDSSGLIITGKKITISGDTTFIGNNFMDGAIIKNASIGSAQIADASITNAKISNLDVNKLSGNISNFIQSNWNGQYGSTTIDANGMTVDTSGITTRFGSYGMTLNMTGESVGGIGVQGLTGQPSDYQGLAFWLDGNAEYMAWGARNNGETSGNPVLKLSWFRNTSAPSGSYSGFNFDDDVIFNRKINVPGATGGKFAFGTKNFQNANYAYFGNDGMNSGIAYGSVSMYLISNNTYYNLTRVIKALDGLGAVKIPSAINSDGTVAKWFNVTL